MNLDFTTVKTFDFAFDTLSPDNRLLVANLITAVEEAKAAYKKADSVKGAWTNTPKLIKKAEAAAAKGDKAKALELAEKAKKEAELGYKQAVHERENWSPPPYAR